MNFLKRNKHIILIVLVFSIAFVLRVSYFQKTTIINPLMKDAGVYVQYAQNFAYHGIFSGSTSPNLVSDKNCMPGYPFFLALFFKLFSDNQLAFSLILFFQAIIGGLTAVMVFAIGQFIFSFRGAAFSAILTALSPHLIASGSYILTETLFTFTMTFAFLVLAIAVKKDRPFFFFAASFLMGLAGLVRPVIILFPIFVLPLIFFYYKPVKRSRTAILLTVGTAIVIAPWLLWNPAAASIDQKKPGYALSTLALGMYPDLIYKDSALRGFPYAEDSENYYKMSTDLSFAIDTLWQRAKKEPFTYLSWYIVGKPAMFWSWNIIVGQGDIYIYPVKTSLYKTNTVAFVTHLIMHILHPFLLFATACGFGIMLLQLKSDTSDKIQVTISILILLILFYFTIIHTVLAPLPRYSIPLRPMLYLGAFVPFNYLFMNQKALKLKNHLTQ